MESLLRIEGFNPPNIIYGFISKTKSEIETMKDVCLLRQVHSNICVAYDEIVTYQDRKEADGFVTTNRDVVLGIQTADCVPVLFYESENKVIGACHAGWRGAKNGVVEATIAKMIEKGADIKKISAIIGPAIQSFSYEVSSDYRSEFIKEDPKNSILFTNSVNKDHYMFDLPQYVINRLRTRGVTSIINSKLDTLSDDRFYSYRRSTLSGNAREGSVISIIGFSND